MSKIINLPMNDNVTQENFLKDVMSIIEKNNVESIVFAVKLSDGNIMTAYNNCNLPTKQELLAHIQIDIINQVVITNKRGN